jgi:colanic acid biosynthesis glycosyl transferase WcaI
MKILIYSMNFSPEPIGIGKYSGEMADWFASRGHDVSVLTAPPYYPYWGVRTPYSGWKYRREQNGPIKIVRCPIWVPRVPTAAKRILHLLSFAISSSFILIGMLRSRPDVLLVVQPSFLSAITAALISPPKGCRRWLHVQDLEIDAALSLGILKSGTVSRWMLRLERWVINRYHRVSTLSQAMMRRLEQKGIPSEKLVLFPNWVDTQAIRPIVRQTAQRASFQLNDDDFVALYAGSVGHKQGLQIVLEAAQIAQTRNPKIVFMIVGEGPAKPELQRIAKERKLANVQFLTVQPAHEFAILLALADVHLVVQKKEAADLVMPSKLATISAAGGAVLATAEPGTEIAETVMRHDLGAVVEPGSANAVAEAVLQMAEDSELCERYRRNSRQFAVDNLDREQVLARFQEGVNSLVGAYSHAG